jgi:hypothetical protein
MTGFDRFASRYDANEAFCRETIVKFAAAKLINVPTMDNILELTLPRKLACLSQRLALEFHSTNYLDLEQEMEQVESHMRVCLKLDSSLHSMTTVSPSEPILAEAAYSLMQREDFNAPEALKSILHGFSIHKGDRGELLAMLLVTLARDAAVKEKNDDSMWSRMDLKAKGHWDRSIGVDEFLKKIFGERGGKLHEGATDTWKDVYNTFKDSKLYFNHFIKVHQHKSIQMTYLMALLARGAAVLCANNNPGIDFVLACLMGSDDIERQNIQLILAQIKNDDKYGANPHWDLYSTMDPSKLIHDPGETPLPVIRIVFALAAKKSELHAQVTELETTEGKKYKAYDFWCAGLTPNVLDPVTTANQDTWRALCQASHGWEDVYKEDGSTMLGPRMMMNPGAASQDEFWSRWYKF